MRVVFIGSVNFSWRMLEELLKKDSIEVVGVCTMQVDDANSDRIDLTPLCERNGVPVRYAPDINSPDSLTWIDARKPEVIFCFGWSRLIRKSLLELVPKGIIGYHPSALPANRGRHPLIWALALGLRETGSTFFAMDEGTDTGEIISQKILPISVDDDAGSLYIRMVQTAATQLDDVIWQLGSGNPRFIQQSEAKANYWRKRVEKDGIIDWRMSAVNIRNLVRSLTKPYLGAHFLYEGKTFKVWECEIEEISFPQLEPGKVLRVDDRGVLVNCGDSALILRKIEPSLIIQEGDYL
jgi:methionyl-tRNA formyltransferase